MGYIRHDWDLAQRKILLGMHFAPIPTAGAVIVYDDGRCENVVAC
jgi:hypothetical protein